ncbi:MAG: hypothetical protein ACI81V_000406 [Lentimonas sp.]|jgi:hypothetical protein
MAGRCQHSPYWKLRLYCEGLASRARGRWDSFKVSTLRIAALIVRATALLRRRLSSCKLRRECVEASLSLLVKLPRSAPTSVVSSREHSAVSMRSGVLLLGAPGLSRNIVN